MPIKQKYSQDQTAQKNIKRAISLSKVYLPGLLCGATFKSDTDRINGFSSDIVTIIVKVPTVEAEKNKYRRFSLKFKKIDMGREIATIKIGSTTDGRTASASIYDIRDENELVLLTNFLFQLSQFWLSNTGDWEPIEIAYTIFD